MINNFYLNKEVIEQIALTLKNEKIVELKQFLDEEIYKNLPSILNLKLTEYFKPELGHYYKREFNNILREQIAEFIEICLKKKLKDSNLYLFKKSNYTLLSDNKNEEEGYKVILELTKEWNNKYGGSEIFLKNNKEIFRTNNNSNSLTIIKTNKSMKSFIKYINHKAKNKERVFVELKFN